MQLSLISSKECPDAFRVSGRESIPVSGSRGLISTKCGESSGSSE